MPILATEAMVNQVNLAASLTRNMHEMPKASQIWEAGAHDPGGGCLQIIRILPQHQVQGSEPAQLSF